MPYFTHANNTAQPPSPPPTPTPSTHCSCMLPDSSSICAACTTSTLLHVHILHVKARECGGHVNCCERDCSFKFLSNFTAQDTSVCHRLTGFACNTNPATSACSLIPSTSTRFAHSKRTLKFHEFRRGQYSAANSRENFGPFTAPAVIAPIKRTLIGLQRTYIPRQIDHSGAPRLCRYATTSGLFAAMAC